MQHFDLNNEYFSFIFIQNLPRVKPSPSSFNFACFHVVSTLQVMPFTVLSLYTLYTTSRHQTSQLYFALTGYVKKYTVLVGLWHGVFVLYASFYTNYAIFLCKHVIHWRSSTFTYYKSYAVNVFFVSVTVWITVMSHSFMFFLKTCKLLVDCPSIVHDHQVMFSCSYCTYPLQFH